jgi:8-oxo-dGTP pyrophosphatase MutT (NUDIX family)
LKFEVEDIIDRLRIELNKPLPGEFAHQKMMPPDRLPKHPDGLISINQAAVLLLLFPDEGNLKTVFIRRPSSMKNHAGQIAFPGGRSELTDKDLSETAIREAVEEIGINSGEVEIIGHLSPVYVQVSNFSIQAYIGWTRNFPSFNIDKREVADIHVTSVDDLLDPASLSKQSVYTNYGITEFPGYMVDDIFIWGATAMILSEFIEVYRKSH